MSNFKFQKTFLAVSTTAAMAGMLVGGQAFAALPTNEQASIEVTSKIVTSTCALDIGGTASSTTAAVKKTLDLGTFSVANVSSVALLTEIGQGVSVVLSLKEGGAAGCTAIGTDGKWDVLIDLVAGAYNVDTNLLNNTTTTGFSGGMSAVIKRQINGTGTPSHIKFSERSPIGVLASGSLTGPNLKPTDKVTITAQMVRGYNTTAPGIYTAIVPLTVVYK